MTSSITAENIKLMKSEVLLDTTDGGGRMTTEEIAAGESNNLFPDTSSLDRVYGRLNLRKAFVSVQTQNTDSLMGANVIVAKKPEDPNIDVTLFSTRDWFDRRTGAQNQMEQYVARGTLWAGHLLETQLKGQRSIQIAVRQNDEEPKVDQCLYLVENEGLASEFYQYVRVEKVSSRLRTFTHRNSDVVRKVVTIETTTPLRHTFTGCTVPEYEDGKIPAAKLRDTQVADAARYYGTRPVKSAPRIGDRNIQADSVFAQLVPTTQTEIVIANHNAAGMKEVEVKASDKVSFNIPYTSSGADGYVYNIGVPIKKGTFQTYEAHTNRNNFVDKNGILIDPATGSQGGRVDYDSGVVYLNRDKLVNSWKTFIFNVAAKVSSPTHTDIIQITQDARGHNYVKTLLPKPVPGTVQVSYQSLDEIYYLNDNGRGELEAASENIGAGVIDYASSTVTLSTGALPDADSAILFSWQTNADAIERTVDLDFYDVIPLPDDVAAPYGKLNNSFMGSSKYADVGAVGVLYDGEKIGHYDPESRCIYLKNNQRNDGEWRLNWSSGDLIKRGNANAPESTTAMLPGSVVLTFNKPFEKRRLVTKSRQWWGFNSEVHVISVESADSIQDDGAGKLLQNGVVVGTINYNTNVISFDTDKLILKGITNVYNGWEVQTTHGFIERVDGVAGIGGLITNNDLLNAFSITFRDAGEKAKSGTATLRVARTEAKLPSYQGYTLQPLKTVVFNSNQVAQIGSDNRFYVSGAYFNYDHEAATLKFTGLLSWRDRNRVSASVYYLKNDHRNVSEIHFRAPAKPLRAGSVQVMFQHAGKTLSYVADSQGRFTGEHIIGTVDYKTGVVSAQFKTKVQTAEGEVETDFGVDVSTLRFNAVAFRNIPLDAELLGIDPVRLPSDGRVPVFRKGNVAVVHNTQSYRLNAPAAGKVYNVGRTRLSAIKVYDSAGKALDPSMYTCDLDAGTVTLASSYRADGLQLPLTAEHRIEDMGVVSDAQINGLVSLTVPLTHDYPQEGTMLSSALVAGDLQARAYNVFTQRTWGNAWADASTDVVTAKYDTANHPITVLNDGATEERWALIFTSSTAFRIVGENLGQIGEGSTNTVTAPINPITGKPYFSIPSGGWGGGWSSGMVMRFNTAAANYPVWVARTVLPGHSSHLEDKFCLMVRGDVDR